jgi:hypothetical protein
MACQVAKASTTCAPRISASARGGKVLFRCATEQSASARVLLLCAIFPRLSPILLRYIRAKQQMGTHGREAEVLTADSLTEVAEGAEACKKQRPLAIVTERYRSELAGSRNERPSASLHSRRRRAGDLSMTDRDDGMAAADSAAGGAGGGDEGERGQDDDAPAARGRRDRSRSASP